MRILGWATVLIALSAVGGSLTSAQDVGVPRVGDGPGSLPALVRVPVAGAMQTGLVVAGHAGYGFTEGVLDDGDSHHRLSGILGASVRPLAWLGIGLRLDGRYDAHSGNQGTDDGFVGEARLSARASTDLSPQLALGVEAVLFVPGNSAPSLDFGATTLDATGLAAWSPSTSFTLAANVGVRIDNTGKAVPERDRLSGADRLALGASDSNAVLLGIGASWRLPAVELVAEVSADLLFGSRAPPLGQSPLRIGAGARVPLNERLVLSILAEFALSSRPAIVTGEALVPVDPRISLLVGLVWRAIGERPTPADEGDATDTSEVPADTTDELATAAPTGRVSGTVRGDDGAPLAGATISVEDASPAVQTSTDDAGAYTLEGVPVGREVRLRITAPGRSDAFVTVTANAETATAAGEIALEPAPPAGVIRGVVRSLRGRGGGLANARIAVEPGGQSARADDDGEFEVEVPPGEYEVVIEAEGHESQRRRVTVEQLGVTVLNVDLRRSR